MQFMIYIDGKPLRGRRYFQTWANAFEKAKNLGLVTEKNWIMNWKPGVQIYSGIYENGRFRRKIQGRYED